MVLSSTTVLGKKKKFEENRDVYRARVHSDFLTALHLVHYLFLINSL
jgi:hypothetical protein